jgi:hypothetical protein
MFEPELFLGSRCATSCAPTDDPFYNGLAISLGLEADGLCALKQGRGVPA